MNFLDRLILEHKELAEKTNTLSMFLVSNTYDNLDYIQQQLLMRQLKAMKEYKSILEARVEHINSMIELDNGSN